MCDWEPLCVIDHLYRYTYNNHFPNVATVEPEILKDSPCFMIFLTTSKVQRFANLREDISILTCSQLLSSHICSVWSKQRESVPYLSNAKFLSWPRIDKNALSVKFYHFYKLIVHRNLSICKNIHFSFLNVNFSILYYYKLFLHETLILQ